MPSRQRCRPRHRGDARRSHGEPAARAKVAFDGVLQAQQQADQLVANARNSATHAAQTAEQDATQRALDAEARASELIAKASSSTASISARPRTNPAIRGNTGRAATLSGADGGAAEEDRSRHRGRYARWHAADPAGAGMTAISSSAIADEMEDAARRCLGASGMASRCA